MRWVILGGGNCYALNLARMLLQQGHEVMGIGRSALKGEAFTLGVEKMGYQYHVYSIGPDTEFILPLIREFEPHIICGFAAQGEGQASFTPSNWKHFYRTNTQSLVELTEGLSYAGFAGKFIQVGTSELYGSVEAAVTEDAPLRPTSPYACSKAAFDMHLASIAKVCGFPAIVIRPSNAFCEGQQLHRIIPKALIYGLTGRRVPLHGGGLARKSYLHADDLSNAILLLAARGEVGQVYNCGPKEPTSIKRLLELVAQCLGMHPTELYEEAPDRAGQDGCYHLDSSKLRALGWEPQVPLLGGLARMHEWVKSFPELLTASTDYRLRA
jgi:dTDP-glucose 4,6-dehydratase